MADKIVSLHIDPSSQLPIAERFVDNGDGTWSLLVSASGSGLGTVTSVALTVPAEFTVTGSPVTTAGTLAIAKVTQAANVVYAGPSSGGAVAPTFRALVLADLPANIAAATAATLATPRAINGVNFDGSAAITIAAAAGTLTGTTLASNVVTSSLTSVGILASPHMTSPVIDSGSLTGSITGNAGTATALQTARTINGVSFDGSANITISAAADASLLTGTTMAANVVTSSLTAFGVMASPHMTAPVINSGGLTITAGGITYSAASDVIAVSNTAAAWRVTDGTNSYHAIDTRTTVSGVVAHSLSATGPTIASAAGVTYSVVSIPAVTTTLTGVTTVTALNGLGLNVAQPTVTDASAQTTTTASTVYIAGAPIAAGSAVLTNKYALHVAGSTRFDGTINFGAANTYNLGTPNQIATIFTQHLQTADIAPFSQSVIITLAASLITLADAANIAVNATTGTKIGTATTQKLAFFNSTPIVQPSAVGAATGFTAGTTAVTFHSDDTYTGNVGSTAYTINGAIAALKNLGLLAA